MISTQTTSPLIDYFVAYALFAVSYILQAVPFFRTDRLSFIKNLCFSGAFIAAGIILLILGMCITSFIVLIVSFLLVILTNRILAAITAKKIRTRLFNILLSLLIAYYLIAILFLNPADIDDYSVMHIIMISGKVLGHIIAISFSQMRFNVLRKILRKTFAAEILFGLVLLIIAFSFVFQALEQSINSFFDALWYSFAVVTTIGFGDITVSSPFSRVLSVVLGIYGIVVVALITSVIVNFYNEVKNDAENDTSDPSACVEDSEDQNDASGNTADPAASIKNDR